MTKQVQDVVWSWDDWDVAVRVSTEVYDFIRSFSQTDKANERGGQLFVDVSKPTGLALSVATAPHKEDRSGRFWLELNVRRCRQEIKRNEARGLRLLGYWHTHPEDVPNISAQDIQSFREFTRKNGATLRYPVCVIVGRKEVRAWSVRENSCIEARQATCDVDAVASRPTQQS